MRYYKLIPVIALAITTLMACNNDDDNYSLGDIWLTTGTILKTSDYYYIKADDGSLLWPSASNIPSSLLKDSLRAIINFTILADGEENEQWDHYVKVNNIRKILTKPYFHFTDTTSQEVRDSIGHNGIHIVDTWFTDQYLNIEFEYGGSGFVTHFVNLVKDDLVADTLGAIVLELKHNTNNDPGNYLQWSIASFDLSGLEVAGQDSISLFIRSIGLSGEYEYNAFVSYAYGDEPVLKGLGKLPNRTIEDLMDDIR